MTNFACLLDKVGQLEFHKFTSKDFECIYGKKAFQSNANRSHSSRSGVGSLYDEVQVNKLEHAWGWSLFGEVPMWVGGPQVNRFRCGHCRGITRIHRSPSRPRPAVRLTAVLINIHEHPL